ncbi:MAG: ABC transporter ATP-binding protein [Pirellulales bacterium]|nr:ABC transporter ATP-binding protein [Pirellulales bacterium]
MDTLCVDHVTKEYATHGKSLVVLRGVSLKLSDGENLAVIGPSGSGKSTLLSIIGTLERPTSGRIELAGEDPFSFDEPALADFRNRQIGFIFQDHHLLPQCTLLENVLIPTLADGRPTPEEIEWGRALIDRIGLTGRIDYRPSELSGGERQRIAIARALIRQPRLLLADEPTGNLDRKTAESVGQLLLELQNERGMMLIIVTHSQQIAGMLSRHVELDGGILR